jgi:hypothetical protein
MSRRSTLVAALACAAFLTLASGCGSDDDGGGSAAGGDLPQGSEPVQLDPADFTTKVDNPYWPLAPDGKPGRKWEMRSKKERIEITVTSRKKSVAGVDALVIRDLATASNGDRVEVTDDWYAQDKDGNVWYLGEDTKEYENGKVVSTEGSWEHGVDGAYAGIIIPADPSTGLSYRQEYFKGEAEDRAKVLDTDASVKVPFGSFDGCLETEDTTPLEPDVVEHKYYAKDLGPVLNIPVKGGGDREELVSFNSGSSGD